MDTLTVFTSTVREDSLRTDSLSHNLLGVINDPVFGESKASSFAQFRLPQVGNVISSQTLDSVVLFLQFTSPTAYYGDLNTNFGFKVYELDQSMNSGITHSNSTYSYFPAEIGSFSGQVNLTDSMNVRDLKQNLKAAPGISIKLESAFAQKMFNANASQLSSQENFLSFFKGIALVPDMNPPSGSGLITAVNLKGAYTKMRIYYNDTMQSDFLISIDSRRFTSYEVSNQSPQLLSQRSFSGKYNYDTTFVQSMAGAKTKIDIPWLSSLIPQDGKRISVGKAELIFRPVAGTYSAPFTLPKRMLLLEPDKETGLNSPIIDLLEPFYDGNYNATANEYRFNITRHLQSLLSDMQRNGVNSNRGLFLVIPSDDPVAPSRIYLDTRKKLSDMGIELKIVYTAL